MDCARRFAEAVTRVTDWCPEWRGVEEEIAKAAKEGNLAGHYSPNVFTDAKGMHWGLSWQRAETWHGIPGWRMDVIRVDRKPKASESAGSEADRVERPRKHFARYQRGANGALVLDAAESIPTGTALMYRVPIFQPAIQPAARVGEWFGTKWGRARVSGRLGQRHASALESVMRAAVSDEITETGGVVITVDLARTRMLMGAHYSFGQMDVLLRELMAAEVEVESPSVRALGRLINTIVKPRRGAGRAERYWRIELGALFIALATGDLNLHWNPSRYCKPLRYGISQAIARHLATHRDQPMGGWRLDDLVARVAGKGTAADARRRGAGNWLSKRKREVQADSEGLKKLGLKLKDGRIVRVAVLEEQGA